MPVYMNSGKIVAGGRDGTGGESKVLQEVLADLKKGDRNEPQYGTTQLKMIVLDLEVPTSSPSSQSSSSAGFPFH